VRAVDRARGVAIARQQSVPQARRGRSGPTGPRRPVQGFQTCHVRETIDSDRIATLVEFAGDYAAYVVVALLPEDARALGGHHRVTEM
jgi:hypothetical protein